MSSLYDLDKDLEAKVTDLIKLIDGFKYFAKDNYNHQKIYSTIKDDLVEIAEELDIDVSDCY